MQLANLQNRQLPTTGGYFGTISESHQVNWDSHSSVCNQFQPYVSTTMQDVSSLYEATYKDLGLLIDGNFLKQQVRADELTGVNFAAFDPEDIMNFYVDSSEKSNNGIKYTNSVQFDEWEDIGRDPDLNFIEKARLLLWVGNIKLHCTCPSFLYWGYQYMCTVMDAAVYPEERFPRDKNPSERGIVCKHLNRVLRVLPFHNTQIATALKQQFG
jgi:hypothetical protein